MIVSNPHYNVIYDNNRSEAVENKNRYFHIGLNCGSLKGYTCMRIAWKKYKPVFKKKL